MGPQPCLCEFWGCPTQFAIFGIVKLSSGPITQGARSARGPTVVLERPYCVEERPYCAEEQRPMRSRKHSVALGWPLQQKVRRCDAVASNGICSKFRPPARA